MSSLPARPAVSTRVDTDADDTPLSPEAARHLTDAIRITASALHVVVHRAYAGRAHVALGYERWADYVAAEFDMSQARSYQLLGQHAVIAALGEVAGTDVSEVVTEKVARDIKPHLAAVLACRGAGLHRPFGPELLLRDSGCQRSTPCGEPRGQLSAAPKARAQEEVGAEPHI
jgi:hypothetical protein